MAATFAVNSALDAPDASPGNGACATAGGVCTLRAAIEEANARAGADAITVPAGTYAITVEPINGNEADSGDFDITGPLTISGVGAGSTVITGGLPPDGSLPEVRGLDRIFEIHPTAGNVTLSGLTMRDGTPYSSSEGGAIWNGSPGTLRLQNAQVLNSFATSYGGGVYSEGAGRLELAATTVSGNVTVGEGGGVFIENGTLAVSGGTIANNSARTGGGIYNAGVVSPAGLRARVEVSGAAITGNTATSGGGGIYNGHEGELILTNTTVTANVSDGEGGGVASTSKSSVSVSGGLFSGNSAGGGGGGLYLASERTLTLSGATFSGNTAVEEGGGLLTDGSGSVSVTGATFTHNQAAGGGGYAIGSFGSVEVSNTAIRNNYSLGGGGGLLNSGNRVTLTRATISGNQAVEDGGGILNAASGEFQIIETSVNENRAANGGGLANDADSPLKVYRTTFWANRAIDGGDDDEGGLGGGVFNQGDAAAEYENVTLSGNYAQTIGGGLFIDADAGVKVVNATITRNSSPVAGGVGEEPTSPPAPGSPPPVPSTSVIFRNTIVAGNYGASECNYAIGSEGGNIADDTSCYFLGQRDRNGVGAGLDAIADNGGFSMTHEPRAESVAVDNGVTPCPATDQRGVTRPRNVRCDSGAVEYTLAPAAPDGDAPDTTITQAPVAVGERAVFSFTGSDGAGTPADQLTFECRLLTVDPTEVPEIPDPTQPPAPEFAFLPCASPYEILGISEGSNTFEVRAIDRAGNIDPTPAQHAFIAGEDVVPPETTITSGPANPSSTRGATFTFSGQDDITEPALIEFECRLDSGSPDSWLECFSPVTFSNLTSGQHTLEVRATDEFGNVDPTPATYVWTVGPPANCDAANVTLAAAADTYVDEGLPLANFGVALSLAVRSDAPGNDASTLLRFALPADLPACDLRSATLRLYSDGEPGRTLQAFVVAAPWAEGQVTWQNQPATSGAGVTATSGSGYRDWNVTGQVAAMLAGIAPNNGWLVRDSAEEDAVGAEQGFAARDTIADFPVTPQLVLRFDGPGEPAPTPPPAPVNRSVTCGMTITSSTRVMNNLTNCPGEGLIVGASNVILDLNGKTIDGVALFGLGQEEGIPAGIRVSGQRNVIIRNGTVREFGNGVHLTAGTTYVVLENLTLTRNVLAGTELTDADNGRNGNEIRNSSFVDNELGVAILNGSENSLVRANTFQGNVGSAVYVFDSSGQRIELNTISGIPVDPTIGSDFGIVLEGAPDTLVLSNTLSDTGDAGIVASAGSHRTLVQGNTLSRVGDAGVLVSESDFVQVISNVAHLTSDAGVSLDASSDGVVRANDVRFNPAGIELGDSSRTLVELNDASYSGTGIGLSGDSLANLIVDNRANATGSDGIAVEVEAIDAATGANLGGNLIARNQTHDGGSDGISVLGGGHTLADNDADNNLAYGIRADGDTIDGGGNTARGNGEPPQCTGVACDPGERAAPIADDLVEPNTTITAAPPASMGESAASVFRFTGSDNIAPATALRFECRLDVPDPSSVEGWVECTSPLSLTSLLPGPHTIEIRAIDPFDNTDSTPATHSWTISEETTSGPDSVAPNTFIVEQPDDPTNQTTATFRFRASDDETPGPSLRYECRLDTATFAPCASPVTYSGLAPGLRSFEVRARDLANNVDGSPARAEWTIVPPSADTSAPETTIVSGPDAVTASPDATFSFASDEAGVSFECAVDGGATISCTTPYTFTGLAVGPHALAVVAVDAAGNRDLSPALYFWEIVEAPEPTAISCGMVVTRSIIATNDLTGCPGDGLIVGAGRITIDLDGFTISGTNLGVGIRNDGHDAVTIRNGGVTGFDFGARLGVGVDDTILESLTFSGNQDAGLLLDGAGSAEAGNTLRDSTVGANGAGVIVTGGTLGTQIQRSVIGGSAGEGLSISGSSGTRVDGSTISGSSGVGVLLDGADGNIITGSRIEANRGGGVELTLGSDNNQVVANTLAENAGGIVVSDSAGNTLLGNTVQRVTGNGIELLNATGTTIAANDVRFNAGGIELFASSGNQIEANNASEASGAGITIGGGSFSNVVYANIASNNDAAGISVEDLAGPGQGNLIERNTANGNSGGGIYVALGGHTITGNTANNNAGWGINAAEGNIDGGSNSATGNGELAQCQGVRCDGGTPIPPGPPETELVLRPADPSPNGYAAFTFTGYDDTTLPPDLGFECRLDSTLDTAWVECENPQEYFGLGSGQHTFEVRAIDQLANPDPTPASYTWTVQLPPSGTPPQTTITFGPGATSSLIDATIAFTSSEPGSTFTCSLDGAPFVVCTSPAEYTDLALGQHTFRVAARDAEGDLDPTPAILTWVIVGPPEVTITVGPDDPTLLTSATFEFTANLASSTYTCSLDGAPFAPCTSPVSYSGLAIGEHLFLVSATAPDGQQSLEAAEYGWTIDALVDTAPPETVFTLQPTSGGSEATFAFSGTDNETPATALTFECRLDSTIEGDFAACESPAFLIALAAGQHTFDVRAIDREGNIDPTPATYTWVHVLDTAAPDTTILTRPDAVTTSATARFTFEASEPAQRFECSLDGAAFAECASPAVYTGLEPGNYSFAVRAVDLAGNLDASPATLGWLVNAAPETTIVSGPEPVTLERAASFAFEASEPGATFECALDNGAFAACTSPRAYTSLSVGEHTFFVRARDTLGLADPTPAIYTWEVGVPPETGINGGPAELTELTTATFAFSSPEAAATFQCSLDEGAFVPCASGVTYTGLAIGPHVFEVRAVDADGLIDPTPADYEWEVVAPVPPETTIASGPPATTTAATASFTFTASEAGSTFECSLDAAPFAACSSPLGLTGLAVGTHTLEVRAVDAAGATDQSPASYTWTVQVPDTIPPDTTITASPATATTSTSATFGFSATEAGSSFQCALNGGAFGPCDTPVTYTGLAAGARTFAVRAVDPAGNVDPTPATFSWTIQAAATCTVGTVTYQANADAWLEQNGPTSNKGTDSTNKVKSQGPSDNFRTVVRFNLPTSIPAGCRVAAATLRMNSPSAVAGRTLQAFQLAGSWQENAITWANQPTVTGPAATTASGTGNREWAVATQVQAIFAAGANYGFLIRDAAESGAGFEQQFFARENSTSRPVLIVQYAQATP